MGRDGAHGKLIYTGHLAKGHAMANFDRQQPSESIVGTIAAALVKIGKNDLDGAVSRLEQAIRLIRARQRQKK